MPLADKRRGLGLGIGVDADQHLFALLDRLDPRGVGGDQRLFHVVDGRHGPALRLKLGELGAGLILQLLDLAVDLDRAVEDVAIVEQVGLVSDDLLQPERPLLVPRPRQAERLVPGGELHGAGARLLRQRHRQHRQQDAIDVVLGLLLGQPQRVHLHAVAEAAQRRVFHAIARLGDLVPQIDEGAHLGDFGDEAHAGIDEERDAADHAREMLLGDFARAPDLVEHRLGRGEREGKLLRRRRSRLLQMVGADIGRVPFRHLARGVDDHVLDQPQRRRGREDVGPAREILFQDVVLHRAGKFGLVGALLLGQRRIEREQPGCRGVDGHRGIHRVERDAREQAPHIAEMGDRYADLADLAARQRVVGIVAGLGRQVEGDREPGLALGEVAPVKLVGGRRRRMSGIGAEQPGLVPLG